MDKKEYYEQLYALKFDDLDNMDQFLERYNLLKFTGGEIDNLNRPTFIQEIESIINNLSKLSIRFIGEFHQNFKEKIILTFYNLLQRIKAEGILSNSLYEISITLTPKPDKHITKKATTDQYLS